MQRILSLLLIATGLMSFRVGNEIPDCFISFPGYTSLSASHPDRLPQGQGDRVEVKTENGEVRVSRLDGYRILYRNEKAAPFVNLKVELSDADEYGADTLKLLDNLKYLIAHSTGIESQVIEMIKNGYRIYGLSRDNIEKGSTLGTFVMFPGNNIVVYFYFNNLKPEFSNFSSLEDYRKQRDAFIDAYTRHLEARCR